MKRLDLTRRLLLGFVLLALAVAATVAGKAMAQSGGDVTPRAYLPIIVSSPGDVLFGPVHTGEGTYYWEADGSGNCLFPATPDDLMVAAMNETDYGNADLCGAYIQASGPKGTVMVRIVDRCPECPQGDVDFSPEAFARIADIPQGRAPISWQLISPAISTPIAYHFKDGSNQWWTAVQIRNHRNPVTKLEYWDGAAWVNVARERWNYFVEPNGMGEGPYTFRVTDNFGHTLIDTDIPHIENGTISGAAQFPPP
jgi:expansin (peptidoglycan-binding protein)